MEQGNEVKVWDLFVRLFHWALVAGFFTAYLVEDELLGLHVWAGYLAFSLVILRILWGFIGTRHARFTDFVRGPRQALAYLKADLGPGAQRYLGHNPAGGLMIIALLFGVLLTGLTGMVVLGGENGGGPLAGFALAIGAAGEQGHEVFEEVHEFFANFTLLLVGIHVAGVVWGSLRHHENLVRAMFTGRKRA